MWLGLKDKKVIKVVMVKMVNEGPEGLMVMQDLQEEKEIRALGVILG